MQACNLVEQTVEFLDETRKKERVRGGERHSILVYLVKPPDHSPPKLKPAGY